MKTWIATIVATPIVFVPLFYLFYPDTADEFPFFKFVVFLIFIGFAFSIPSLLLIGLISVHFEKLFYEAKKLKIVTILASSILIMISFVIFFSDFKGKELLMIVVLGITYIAAIFVFGFWFKITSPKHQRSPFSDS